MPDIHIGKSIINKKKGLVSIELFFHVPNNKANNTHPGLIESLDNAGVAIPVSVVPGVTADELTTLKDGTLCEVVVRKLFDLTLGEEKIKTEIKNMWQEVASNKQMEIDQEYILFGTTLPRS